MSQAALKVTPSDDSWLIAVEGGKLRQTGWPEIGVESAHLRYREGMLYVTESRLQQGNGFAKVTGEIDLKKRLEMQVAVEGLDVTPLLTGDWRARLTGKLYGDATVHAGLGENKGPVSISGSAHLAGGQLTALPVLDQIATFTQTQRFRTLALSTASLDFTQEGDRFTARHVIAETEGLIRVEGNFTLVAGQIDGAFEVGVTAASLQWLPGSQARVFTIARNGYYWAPLRLTGPVNSPTEDLTPRLAEAAAGPGHRHGERGGQRRDQSRARCGEGFVGRAAALSAARLAPTRSCSIAIQRSGRRISPGRRRHTAILPETAARHAEAVLHNVQNASAVLGMSAQRCNPSRNWRAPL